MKLPKKPHYTRWVIIISWLVVTALLSAIVIWGSLKFAGYDNAIEAINTRPPQQVIEKELQPIYTTIVGQKGDKGNAGKDSVSTHTVIEKDTTIVQQQAIPGPQGDKGDTGTSGKTPEFALDSSGHLMMRYVGDRFWTQVPTLGGDSE